MKLLSSFKTLFDGVIMGIAEIVPGVSASTATLLLGIYDDFINLLDSVTEFIKTIFQFVTGKVSKADLIKSFKNINLLYGIILFLGMAIGIVLFSNIVDFFYESNKSIVQSIFFGIILASILIPYKVIKKFTIGNILFLITGFLSFYLVLRMGTVNDADSLPYWLIFLGGTISVSGLVLPGVNSSFVLIPLGVYELILKIVTEFSRLNFNTEMVIQVITFIIGVAFGVISFVKILKYSFKHHLSKLFSLIAGIMIASLFNLWPFQNISESKDYISVLLLILISTILTFLFIQKTNPEKEISQQH